MSHTLKTLGTLLVGCGALTMSTAAHGKQVFHVGFNEGTGSPAGTYLGTSIDGVVGGTVTYDSQVNPFAGSGYSMYIPGNSHAVNFTLPTSLNEVDFSSGTIAAWVNIASFKTGGNRIFTTRAASSDDAFDFYIYDPSHATKGGRIELHAGNGSGFSTYATSDAIFSNDSLNQWYFIAVTWDADADQLDFYMADSTGVLDHLDTITGININPAHHASYIRLGNGPFATNLYHGLIDEFYLFDHALTASQLRAIIVPEPAAGLFVAFGGLVLMRMRRR